MMRIFIYYTIDSPIIFYPYNNNHSNVLFMHIGTDIFVFQTLLYDTYNLTICADAKHRKI